MLQPGNLELVPKWRAVLGRHRTSATSAERRCEAGDDAACGLRDWQTFLTRLGDVGTWEKLRAVNININRRPYREDPELWRVPDYWAAPEEFLARGGDCEDYAIAKYLALRSLGISPEDLRLSVVYDEAEQVIHAVLLVDLPAGRFVLDSLTDFVLPWSEFGHYRLFYSVNEQAAWFGRQASRA